MFKKFALMVIMIMMIPAAATARIQYNPDADASKVTFSDIKDTHWARDTIYKLAAQEARIFNGYPDGTFMPEKTMSRAEFVTALIRALGYESAAESTFPDVPKTHWASKYIGTAQEKGIIEPNDYGNFMPEGNITRYEVCKMLVNSYAKSKELVNDESIVVDVNPSDARYLDAKSRRMVKLLYDNGILKGYPDGTVQLGNNSTRAELATFILRFILNSDKLENAELSSEGNPKEDYRDGVKFIGKTELPAKMVRLQNYDDQSPLDVQVTINKVSMFKYDENYKGEYKALLDKASSKVRYFTEYTKYKLKNSCIIAIDAVTVNGSGHTIPDSGASFEISFSNNNTNIVDKFDDYFIKQLLIDKPGDNFWVNNNSSYKYTTFIIVDKLPSSSINLSKIYFTYLDSSQKTTVGHKDNYQVMGIDLTK